MIDLKIINARIVAEYDDVDGSLLIDQGTILAVIAGPDDGREARRVIDAQGRYVLPGLIDPHVHLGLGGRIGLETMTEDFRVNTRDFLIGGVTTFMSTSIPQGPASIRQAFDEAVAAGSANSWANFLITAIPSFDSHNSELVGITSSGGRDFKFFAGFAGDQAADLGYNPAGVPFDFFYESCSQLKRHAPGSVVKIHAEEPLIRYKTIDEMRRRGIAGDLVSWAESSPEWSESIQLFAYATIANDFGLVSYPVHVSSAHTVETMRLLRARGVKVVGETVVAFLLANTEQMHRDKMGAFAKIQPPIRSEFHQDALWQGIRDGLISIIGTDGLSYTAADRAGDDFWDCRVGLHFHSADTLSLIYDEGVLRRSLSMRDIVGLLSANAAKLYGLYPRKGSLAPGADADVVIFDTEGTVNLGPGRYTGSTDYSIWAGRTVRGAVTHTVLGGEVVVEDGEFTATAARGKHVGMS